LVLTAVFHNGFNTKKDQLNGYSKLHIPATIDFSIRSEGFKEVD
jgi:hypothetical protein